MIDLLVIGSGGAGLSAAITAKEQGANVLVVTKQHPTHAGTSQAQGGINGVLSFELDSVEQHIEDTIKAAHGLADEKSVELMCGKAKESIEWLDSIGVPFSRNEENQIAQRKFGGGKFDRTCYSSDYTGLKILHTLYDRCIKDDIEFLNEHLLLNLIVEGDIALGATFLDILTGEVKQILAKTTILATGGYAGIYNGYTTNSSASTGDGVTSALRAGCRLSNMEFIQFHPTALKNSKVLISESARGEGGYLVNSEGDRFVDELLPRDIVARAIYDQMNKNKEVFLDIRHLGLDKINKLMPQEKELAKIFEDVDVENQLIPISPVAHYSMGGIKTDIDTKTNIKNLFACGECAEAGVHGANRLGGNSLLEIVTFGRISGSQAIKSSLGVTIEDKEYEKYAKDKEYIDSIYKMPNQINFYHKKDEIGELFYNKLGLYRDEKKIESLISYIDKCKDESKNMGIGDKSKEYNQNLVEFLEFQNILELSELILKNALYRKESRGAHFRLDYPDEENIYQDSSISYIYDNDIVVNIGNEI